MISLLLTCLVASFPQETGKRRDASLEPQRAQTRTTPDSRLQLYDVAHLTGHRRMESRFAEFRNGFPQAWLALEALENLSALRASTESTTNSLLESVREAIRPALAEGQRVDHLEGGTIALLASPVQQTWLDDFLANAAAFDGLVDIQTRIHILESDEVPESAGEGSGRVLGPSESHTLLLALEESRAETVNAPRVVVLPFQEAELSAVEQVAYIQDYDLQVLPEEQHEIADPVIGIAQSGVVLRLRAVPLGGERLGIWAEIEYSELVQPIATKEIRIGSSGQKVTIQLPDITRARVEGRFELDAGETLLLQSDDPTGEEVVLVLLTAKRVEAEREPR